MARGASGAVSPDASARAIAIGVLSNTALKLGIALVLGSAAFRWIVGGTLAGMIVAAAAALALT